MKHIKLALVIFVTLFLAGCKDDGNRQVVSVTSPNGQVFHYMPVWEDGVTDVTVMIAWPMPWTYQAGKNPATPYIATEALRNSGTQDLSVAEAAQLFNDTNTFGQISTIADHAYGELTFPMEHKDTVVPVVAQILAHPGFDENWVERAKQNLKASQVERLAQSSTQMWAAARLAVLGDTPLFHFLSLDDPSVIDQVTPQDLMEWHDETLVKSGITVAVTGAISQKDAGQVVDQLLAGLPEGPAKTTPPSSADFSPRTILLHKPDAQKTTLGLLGPLPPTTDGKDIQDLLALHYFGRPDGPLFTAVRTELRASYGLQVGYDNYSRTHRVLFITGEVDPEKLAETTQAVRKTYDAFRTNPDWSDYETVRTSIEQGTRENIAYVDVAAKTIIESVLDGLDPANAPKLADTIAATTSDQVAERLRTSFPAGDQLLVFAVSPDATALPGACVITQVEQVLSCP